MRSAIVAGGRVVNVIVGQVEGSIPCDEAVGIGWTYDGEFHAPPPDVEPDQNVMDQDALNRMLASEGSVVRALAVVMFEEVNRLRVRAGLTAYTLDQFKTALKNRMRA